MWCYFRLLLFPWEQRHTPATAKNIISNPRPGVQRATTKLFHSLEDKPGTWVDDDVNRDQAGVPLALATDSPEFAMLKRSHDEWTGLPSVKDYKIWQASWITGGSKRTSKSGTRLDKFHSALDRADNFFFDRIAEDEYAVAPYKSIDDFLTLPTDIFGGPDAWLPFNGVSGYSKAMMRGSNCVLRTSRGTMWTKTQ